MAQRGGLVVVYLATLAFVCCQKPETAEKTIARNLRDCYNESAIPGILDARNRPPATLSILLDIIRKIENTNPQLNARAISLILQQVYRQDGIQRANSNGNSVGLPFSASENARHALLVDKFIPISTENFIKDGITPMETCTLHYLISTAKNRTIRGDESSVCSRIARYTSRNRRDVEQLNAEPLSTCPIEGGVIYTKYGVVNAANLLAGVAAGLEYQEHKEIKLTIPGTYACTIASELAKYIFQQSTGKFQLGASGNWDNILSPKTYYLSKNENIEVTDASIRGALDGFILSQTVKAITDSRPETKLSQIIDMYYSPIGVFNNSLKACNRKKLAKEYISTPKLVEAVAGFSYMLQTETPTGTYEDSKFTELATEVVNTFNAYITNELKDERCLTDLIESTAADVIIFVDTKLEFSKIQPIISYILYNINVNKYGTQYTIISGNNGTTLVNKTSSLTDMFNTYNQTSHSDIYPNFDYRKVVEISERLGKQRLNNVTAIVPKSRIVLLFPKTVPSSDEKRFMSERYVIFKNYIPDLQFIVLAETGTKDDYTDIIGSNPKYFVTINQNAESQNNALKVIKEVPRSIVNPNCGSEFKGTSENVFRFEDSIPVQGIVYYKLLPNYFFDGASDRKLIIKESNRGSINVCISTNDNQPANSDSCKILERGAETHYDLSNVCSGSFSDCNSVYISVEGKTYTSSSVQRDTRFPFEISYIVTLDHVGCHSSTAKLISNFPLILALVFVVYKIFK